ncbi:MAG: response regulator [Kangiellaceae bacterium]|jgi:DNA-binding NtrC family response regulator|nr:response regulator [Kangiellaceae bacterium]
MTIVYYLDDEPELCEIFTELFSSDLTTIKTFTDADQAISAVNQDKPDVFFIDYRLVGTTGDIVALNTREDIKKVLITGDLTFNSQYKFSQVINKPYPFDQIQKVIASS